MAICCDANMRALWAIFGLNTAFTIAQLCGAAAANSLALMGDTGTMAVDSMTYAINLYAEYNKSRLGADRAEALEIGASVFSVVALLGVTAYVMRDAIDRLNAPQGDGDGVNPSIMLFFTSLNLLIDFGMCGSIVLRHGTSTLVPRCLCPRCCCRRRHDQHEAEMQRQLAPASLFSSSSACHACDTAAAGGGVASAWAREGGGAGGGEGGREGGGEDGGESGGEAAHQTAVSAPKAATRARENLNMCSAFAHVLADTMRTLTVNPNPNPNAVGHNAHADGAP